MRVILDTAASQDEREVLMNERIFRDLAITIDDAPKAHLGDPFAVV